LQNTAYIHEKHKKEKKKFSLKLKNEAFTTTKAKFKAQTSQVRDQYVNDRRQGTDIWLEDMATTFT